MKYRVFRYPLPAPPELEDLNASRPGLGPTMDRAVRAQPGAHCRPFGTFDDDHISQAVNCRAIVNSPCGRDARRILARPGGTLHAHGILSPRAAEKAAGGAPHPEEFPW